MTEKQHISRRHIARHLHRRIVIQLTLFVVISLTLFTIVIIDSLTNNLNLVWILLGAVIGVGLGYIVGKAFKLNWHEDSQKIIMKIDRTGFAIIIVYVLIRSLANSEAGNLFDGLEFIAVTYSLLGGIMIGRLLSMGRTIVRLLREQQII
jgi:hypothetical protein